MSTFKRLALSFLTLVTLSTGCGSGLEHPDWPSIGYNKEEPTYALDIYNCTAIPTQRPWTCQFVTAGVPCTDPLQQGCTAGSDLEPPINVSAQNMVIGTTMIYADNVEQCYMTIGPDNLTPRSLYYDLHDGYLVYAVWTQQGTAELKVHQANIDNKHQNDVVCTATFPK